MVNYGCQMEVGERTTVGISIDLVQTLQLNYALNNFWGDHDWWYTPVILAFGRYRREGQEYRIPPLPSDHTKGRKQKALQVRGQPGQADQGFTVSKRPQKPEADGTWKDR